MNVLMANIIALSMPDAKIHTEDTIVNVSQDLREMEKPVHVCWIYIPSYVIISAQEEFQNRAYRFYNNYNNNI